MDCSIMNRKIRREDERKKTAIPPRDNILNIIPQLQYYLFTHTSDHIREKENISNPTEQSFQQSVSNELNMRA